MNQIQFLKISFFLISAILVGAQLNASMPEKNKPYSFEYFDKNRDGTLGQDELSILLLSKMDIDRNGYLIEDEWGDSVVGWNLLMANQSLRDLYHWDLDKNSQINLDEIQNILIETKNLSVWDADKNKKISRVELYEALQKIYSDGNISEIDMHEWVIFLN